MTQEFRDLNGNGQLDPYENPDLPIEERIEDLLSQMTLEEKAGMMFQTMIAMGENGAFDENVGAFGRNTPKEMFGKHMNTFNLVGAGSAEQIATWYNDMQKYAENTRLGIPVTLSTDPRHTFSDNPGAHLATTAFSQWPEPTGLAAIGDEDLVEEFGNIARQEYVAVGLRLALHPMADLATEPRWARSNGTFGENAELSGKLTAAYIRGFQGKELGKDSVACMTKHFPGGGPQKDGEDPHFNYGREQVYPGDNFDYHLIPFHHAFEAKTAQIMPYYGMPIGTKHEEVGFAYSKGIITDMLRGEYGFDGVVCTDWGLVTDVELAGRPFPARAWGVEHLTPIERVKKLLDAGCDQLGGESCPEHVIELVNSGQISEDRIDESIRRILRDKFRMGLFDNPYVNVEFAKHVVGNPAFRSAGNLAQRKSIVLLKNQDDVLPLSRRPKLYIEGIAPEIAEQYGDVVETVEEADFAILRLKTPFEPRSEFFLQTFFHEGSLAFNDEEKARILAICDAVPTIVDIYLERAAVIPEIAEHCAGLTANFGSSADAILDIIFGRFYPIAKLPFELPSSMEAVVAQRSDMPSDSENPLFEYGFGLTY